MKHILVIDDDHALRTVLAAVLQGAGYEVTQAADGEQGLAQFYASKPDLVLTDLVMPVKEGVEVIMELRRSQPQVPIIVMSSGGLRGHTLYLQLAQKLGAARQLEKPFSMRDLLAIVHEVLGGSRAIGS